MKCSPTCWTAGNNIANTGPCVGSVHEALSNRKTALSDAHEANMLSLPPCPRVSRTRRRPAVVTAVNNNRELVVVLWRRFPRSLRLPPLPVWVGWGMGRRPTGYGWLCPRTETESVCLSRLLRQPAGPSLAVGWAKRRRSTRSGQTRPTKLYSISKNK
jgi:hypothetical protein